MTYLRVGALVFALSLGAATCDWGPAPGSRDATDARADTADGTVDTFEPREAGEACDAPAQCVDGATCIGNPLDNYTCMHTCERVWTLCEDGSVCTPVASGSPICYTGGVARRGERCESNLDCQSGLLCVGIAEGEYHCLEACHTSEGGCEENEYCEAFGDAGKGYCRTEIGAPCTTNATCPRDLDCTTSLPTEIRSQFPGGYCTKSDCETDADCPGDARCRTYPNTEVSMCFDGCELETDCRLDGDYVCLTRNRCLQTAGADNCNNFRDGVNLCVPPPLTTWSGG